MCLKNLKDFFAFFVTNFKFLFNLEYKNGCLSKPEYNTLVFLDPEMKEEFAKDKRL